MHTEFYTEIPMIRSAFQGRIFFGWDKTQFV